MATRRYTDLRKGAIDDSLLDEITAKVIQQIGGSTGGTGTPGGPRPVGPTGATGVTGAPGPKGQTGAAGLQGPTGPAGATGAPGLQGVTGAPGSKGETGAAGLQGSTGVAGPKGETGAPGIPGVTGPTGVAGPKGETGAPGLQGITGPAGAQGATGADGLQGPAGQNFVINNTTDLTTSLVSAIQADNTYSSSNVYFFLATSDARSNALNSGPDEISVSTDLTNHLLMWNGTIWNDLGQFTGVKGDKGQTGAIGPAGATGVAGQTGVTGLQGPAGITGAPGAKGATGADGLQGPSGPKGPTGADADNNQIAIQLSGIQSFQDAVAASTAKTIGGDVNTYSDGLYKWSGSEQISEALDQVNVVLSALAPKPAKNIGESNIGIPANGSDGQLNLPADYEAVGTLSGSSANSVSNDNLFSANTYSAGSITGIHRRLGIRTKSDLQLPQITDLIADGINYAEGAFKTELNSNGTSDTGVLKLMLNGSEIASYDLATGSTFSAIGSGFTLSNATSASFPNGDTFDSFKHRTGSAIVKAADQRNGWNYLQVIYDYEGNSATAYQSQYIDWVVDDGDAIAVSNTSLTVKQMSSDFSYISGLKYHTGGTLTYAATIANLYSHTYSTGNVTFSTLLTSDYLTSALGNVPVSTPTSDSSLIISHDVDFKDSGVNLLGEQFGLRINNIPHPVRSINNQGSALISNILLHNKSSSSTDTFEDFVNENKRIKVSSILDTQQNVIDVLASDPSTSRWDPTQDLTSSEYNSELFVYDEKLQYPTGSYSSITHPATQPDYSSLTGTREYLRAFKNDSGGSKDNFNLQLSGNGTIIDTDSSLVGNQIQVLVKLPGKTAWLDIAKNFLAGFIGEHSTSGQFYGAKGSTLSTNLNSNPVNNAKFGEIVGINDYVLVRIIAADSWTGHISSINVTWS